jgi:long-subunit fatty acid transport protein
MGFIRKLLGLGALTLASLTFNPKKAEACSSAVPMGRGATNVAVADDASAAYWNPAGLVQLEMPELDLTYSPNNWYRGFLCYATPLNKKSAIGANLCYKSREDAFGTFETYWAKASYSQELTENLSLGVNYGLRTTYQNGEPVTDADGESYFECKDLGILYKPNKKLKLGLLLQNHGVLNVRPGASLTLNDKTLAVVEGYNITNAGHRELRLGLEHKINESFSARGGILYAGRAVPTLGFSYTKGNTKSSVAVFYDESAREYDFSSNKTQFLFSLNKKLN